jgi:hypothetical protein
MSLIGAGLAKLTWRSPLRLCPALKCLAACLRLNPASQLRGLLCVDP